MISWLPAAHIAERERALLPAGDQGLSVTSARTRARSSSSCRKVSPTWFFAVPRILEKLKAGLEAMLAGLPDEQREPAEKGLEAALAKVPAEQAGEEVPAEVAEAAAAGRRADVLAAAQAARARRGARRQRRRRADAARGARVLPRDRDPDRRALGHVGDLRRSATINPPDRIKLGTVGPPMPGVEIKLAEDGEVLVKADCVMPGYRNMPEKNAETIDRRRLAARPATSASSTRTAT